jgi:hypothetical protein
VRPIPFGGNSHSEDSDDKGESEMSESAEKKVRVLVIGTQHELQRHQDAVPDREELRSKFDKRLRQIINERKLDLIAEEAGDDAQVWKNLKENDELAEAFGDTGYKTVDNPVSTIAKRIADEYRVRHEDVDVDVRAKEDDLESIEKRDEAIAARIIEVLRAAERVLVIVGEKHQAGVAKRLRDNGLTIELFNDTITQVMPTPAQSPDRLWFQKAKDAAPLLSVIMSLGALIVSGMSWYESHVNRYLNEAVDRPVLTVDKIEVAESSTPDYFDVQVTYTNNGKVEAEDVRLDSLVTHHCNPNNELSVTSVPARDKPAADETGYFVGLQPNRNETYSIPIRTIMSACNTSSSPTPRGDQYIWIESTVTYTSSLKAKHVTVWQAKVKDGKKRTVSDFTQANY